jgi:hypothetical protein
MSENRSERLELLATVLLGIATATSAWCTYQGQLWSSKQLEDMARASRLQAQALRATDVLTREAVVDATTFANVLAARTRGEHRLVHYLTEVARPAFRPPLEAWLARDSRPGPRMTSPFDDATYRAVAERPWTDLDERADAALAAANVANQNSDLFGMRTVMVALSLFFLGISGQLAARSARRLAITIGALVLVLTIASLTRLQRAERPRAGTPHAATSSTG